jgi:hypothetical protein
VAAPFVPRAEAIVEAILAEQLSFSLASLATGVQDEAV